MKSDLKVDDFWPETYKLDSVSHLADFLNKANDGLWILKKSLSNCGRGIQLISDIQKFKEDIWKKQDEEQEQSSTDIFLEKMREAGIDEEVKQA